MTHWRLTLAAMALAALAAGCGQVENKAVTSAMIPSTTRHGGATPAPLSVSPQPLDFTVPGTTQSFTVTDPGYAGALKAKVPASCSAVAKVAGNPLGPIGTFDVTSIGAGRCDVTVTGKKGQKITETIHVTVTRGTIN